MDASCKPTIEPDHPEQADFPRAGYRARRWSRFERDLFEWMNRPEGKFECWLASRKVAAPVGASPAGENDS